jgi:DNA-directed RNA polymerase subunit RPC12/RpoP
MSHFINLGTGIACPHCGDELQDTNPSVVTTSLPPQKAVHCNTCKFKSFIVA